METKLCANPNCTNTIKSRKKIYCETACKQEAYRIRKETGMISGNGRRRSVSRTGDLTTDLSITALDSMMGNAISGKSMASGITGDLARAGIPYVKDSCLKRPVKTLVGFGTGVAAAGLLFKKCETTLKGKSRTRKCTSATGMQKVGTGIALAIGLNLILDNWQNVTDYVSSVTDSLRNSYVTGTVTDPVKPRKLEYYQTTAN